MILEGVVEIVFEGWALAVDAVTDRYGRLAGLAMFFLPWVMLALIIWLIVVLVG